MQTIRHSFATMESLSNDIIRLRDTLKFRCRLTTFDNHGYTADAFARSLEMEMVMWFTWASANVVSNADIKR